MTERQCSDSAAVSMPSALIDLLSAWPSETIDRNGGLV